MKKIIILIFINFIITNINAKELKNCAWKNEKGIGVNFLDLRRTDKHKIQGYLSLSSH